MARSAFGSLHNDVAAVKRNSGVAAACAYLEGTALVHVHGRSVGQAKYGARSSAGAQMLAFFQLVAGSHFVIASVGDEICGTIDRLHFRANPRRHLPVGFVDERRGDDERKRAGQRPAESARGRKPGTTYAGEGPVDRRVSCSTAEMAQARPAVAQVSFDKQRSCRGKAAVAIGRKQGAHSLAIFNLVLRDAGLQRNTKPIRYSCGRSRHRCGIRHIVPYGCDCLPE